MARNDDWASAIGGLLSGFSNAYFPMLERKDQRAFQMQKLAMDMQQRELENQFRRDQLADAAYQRQFQRDRQDKADWQSDYDRGMKQIANNYLNGVLTGQNPTTPDATVYGYMDPNVLAGIQQKSQDQAWTKGLMDAIGRTTGGSGLMNGPGVAIPPANPPGPKYGPTSDAGNMGFDYPGAAQAAGVPELASFLPKIVQAESGGSPTAKASTSSAFGLGQFTTATRQAILDKYGVDAWSKDPNEQIKALAFLAKDNRDGLASSLGVDSGQVTPQQIYMANFLGQNGATKFLQGVQLYPNEPAVKFVSPAAAQANAGIFYDKTTGQPRTTKQVFDLMGNKVASPSDDQRIMGAANGEQPSGQVFAQNGPQVVSDASGNPRSPGMGGGQPNGNYWANMATAVAPFVAAPGRAGEAAKNIIGMAKTMTDLTQPQYDIVERPDGTYAVDKRTTQYRKIEGIPGKDTGNFTDPNDKLIFKLAPGYGNGNSEEQDRQYEQAWYNKYGNPRTMPDGSIVRMTPPPNIPTPNGIQTGEVAGKKPLTANDAGKIQGANLSTIYLNDVEKKLFPGGKYDRTAMMKSYLPGTDEADIRNKIREAIGYALYLKTGAAATPKEIAEQETLYTPGLADSEMTAKSKLDRLKAFLSSVVQGTGRDRANGATGSEDQQTPVSPDIKSKYGLE